MWDVSKVKYMEGMFYNCRDFNPGSDFAKNWDVSSVVTMKSMYVKLQT